METATSFSSTVAYTNIIVCLFVCLNPVKNNVESFSQACLNSPPEWIRPNAKRIQIFCSQWVVENLCLCFFYSLDVLHSSVFGLSLIPPPTVLSACSSHTALSQCSISWQLGIHSQLISIDNTNRWSYLCSFDHNTSWGCPPGKLRRYFVWFPTKDGW